MDLVLDRFIACERVYAGNTTPGISTATSIGRVNYRNDGKFEIIDIKGEGFTRPVTMTRVTVTGNAVPEYCCPELGQTFTYEEYTANSSNGIIIYGEESGFSMTLNNFVGSTIVEAKDPWDSSYFLVADDYDYEPDPLDPVVYGDPDYPIGRLIMMDWAYNLEANTRDCQQDATICVINIVEPYTPFTINTSNVVMQDGDYIVLNAWFDNGANTDASNIYTYTVVV